MEDKLFEILREYSNNTLVCHAKISAYIAELLNEAKKPEKKTVKKTVKKKEK